MTTPMNRSREERRHDLDFAPKMQQIHEGSKVQGPRLDTIRQDACTKQMLQFQPLALATSYRNITGVNGLLYPSSCTVVDF